MNTAIKSAIERSISHTEIARVTVTANEWTQEKYSDFLDGFAMETELDRQEAENQWAGFSNQLSDSERREVEAGGWEAGITEGEKFTEMFPSEEENE